MTSTRVAIHGAGGRMGRRLVALALAAEDLTLTAALERPGHERLGSDAGELVGGGTAGLALAETPPQAADAMIDFSTPDGTRRAVALCLAAEIPLVVGTTGLDDTVQGELESAAKRLPVLQAPNMSLGVNLLLEVAAQVAASLGASTDVEITEAHHNQKKDAPSGTAWALARAIAEATGRSPEQAVAHGREGHQPREEGEIGMHALRLGDVVGRHTAHFAGAGEEIQLGHVAHTRDVFARGALRAAGWLAGQQPGLYAMRDVLGLGGTT